MDIRISEAYQSIYQSLELKEEFLSEEYDGIENLTEEDFDDIAEETVYEVLEEGIEVDELDEIFEAVIMELNPYAPAGSKGAREYQKSTSASKRGAEREAAVSAAKEKVKSSVKGAVKKVKTSALDAKDSAQKTAKGLKQQSHVGVAKYASKHNLVKGAGLKTQSSKGRGELRSAVAKHVGSRIKDKIKSAVGKVKQKVASAAVSGYAAARSAKQAVSDFKNSAVQSAKNTAAVAKRNVKGAAGAAKVGAKSVVGKAARAVASGAGKVASKLGEEFDTYEIVLEYLFVEGYAEDLEDAESIMAYLDSEAVEEIAESGWHRRNPDQIGSYKDPDVKMKPPSSSSSSSSSAKKPWTPLDDKKEYRRTVYNYYGEGGKKDAIRRAIASRDAARSERAKRKTAKVEEATAMAKRGLDEPAIRTQIAKNTGGGQAADRATTLADRKTFGQRGVDPKARQNLARAQRGDFRKTTSSSPGLKGYAYKATTDSDKAKQAARGAQRGALTPKEKKQFGR